MPKNDALARRWPNGDGGRWQVHLAGFTQEEITEKVGMHRSVVSRDLQSARDVCRRGDSSDLEVASFTQTAVRKQGQAPYMLYDVEARYTTSGSKSPLSGQQFSPEEAAASWNERRIYDPLVDGYGPQLKL